MPRLPRVHLTGVLYYATQQGTPNRPLFQNEEDCQTYLELLTQYKTKHEFHLFGFSLHADKIHLILEPYGSTTISEIMRDLTSRYSKYCNTRYGGAGSLFKGRFHTVIAEKESLLTSLIHLVHSLPGCMSFAFANSRSLYGSEGGILRDAIRTEIAEVQAQLERQGGAASLAGLTLPMGGEALDQLLQTLKDPVIGSPLFVKKIRAELSDAAASHARKEEINHEPVLSEISAPVRTRNLPVWIPVLACAMLIVPVSWWAFSQKLSDLKKSSPATALVQPETTPAEKTLHASVIVLDGTEWNVKLIPMGQKDKTPVEFDRIRFTNDQVVSKNMAAKGFQPTFYTLTTNPDGAIVWETMQTGPSGEIVAWRGESADGQMRGVISQQLTSGETKTFHFVGSK